MLGRGMVCDPGLASAIRSSDLTKLGAQSSAWGTVAAAVAGAEDSDSAGDARCGQALAAASSRPALAWAEVLPLFEVFWGLVQAQLPHRQQAGRLKQWLHLLSRRHPEAEAHHRALRAEPDAARLASQVLQGS
jgi:tRNA-dihydrouridine synthase C